MKIVVCGAGPLGIEMAINIDSQGGEVILLSGLNLGGEIKDLYVSRPLALMESSFKEITSIYGRSIVSCLDLEKVPTVKEYWDLYLENLVKHLQQKNILKFGRVTRIHKCRIGFEDHIVGKERLNDLFRVVFINTEAFDLEKQQKDNPIIFENINSTVIESLKEQIESFVECDMVVNATGVTPKYMGACGSFAINENMFSQFITYGNGNKTYDVKDNTEVIIVGSDKNAASILLQLKDQLINNKISLKIIFREATIFEKLSLDLLTEKADGLIKQMQEIFEDEVCKFEAEINKWKNLDDHIRVKISPPAEPEKRIALVSKSQVISVEKLIDKDKYFLISEELQTGNDKIKSYSADYIFVCTGYSINNEMEKGLETQYSKCQTTATSSDGTHEEPGFYTLGPVNNGKKSGYQLKDGILQIRLIQANILNYFTRVED